MKDIVSSIFRQREIEKLYELGIRINYKYYFGSISVGDETLVEVANEKNVISDKEIGRYDIEIPMLEVGDEFFLHDIQEVVKIKSRTRSSDGSIAYYVEDKVIETDNTRKSYAECREKIEHWGYEKEKYKKLEEEFNDYKNKYKYEHRFFNSRR